MKFRSMPVVVSRPASSARRGVTLIFLVVGFVVLAGFVALAVDVGRIRLAKTELQVAADGAARAAVFLAPSDASAARDKAVQIAAANVCRGDNIVLDPDNDVELGHWDRAKRLFTPLTSKDKTKPNAVRVTTRRISARNNPIPLAIAPIIGIFNADVQARATAAIMGAGGTANGGIIGIDSVRIYGTANTDSYNSSIELYNPNKAGDGGDVLSPEGWIDVIGSATVHGSAFAGPGEDPPHVWPNAEVTGVTDNLVEPLDFPPVDASPYATNNDNTQIQKYINGDNDFRVVGQKNNAPIPAGVYYVHDLIVEANASLTIGGDVIFYVTGEVKFEGTVNTYNSVPGNLQINVAGSGDVDLGGKSDLFASVYAPESDVNIHGTGDYFGSVIGQTLEIAGTTNVHYDEALNKTIEIPSRVSLVQ